MAQQADGTVYIDTLLDTTGFKAGGKDVEAAVRRMSKTVSGIGETAKIALQKQTDAFVKANQAFAKQEQKVDSIKKKLEELSDQKVSTENYNVVNKEIAKLEKSLDKAIEKQIKFVETGGNRESRAFEGMEYDINQISTALDNARKKKEQLESSGGAYQTVDTSGVEQKLIYEQQRLQQMNNSLSMSFSSLTQKVRSLGGGESGVERLKSSIIELRNSVNNVLHPTEAVKFAFSSFIANIKDKAAGVAASVINGIAHPFQTVKNIAEPAIKKSADWVKRLGEEAKKAAKNIANKLVSGLKKAGAAMLGLHKSTKKSSGSLGSSLKTMLKYGLGIRSIYALVNKLRSALVDGFKNLAQYDSRTNTSISSLMSALTQLKNSFATAFAPILNVVAPILKTFINMVSRAVTYVGMLIASLTGQSTFTKAVEVTEDYAAGMDKSASSTKKAAKENKKYLSGLDEIQRYETDSDSGSGDDDGGGYTPPTPGEMFEEVPIENSLKNLADKLKEAWKNADFTEIGTMVGEKIRDVLDSIDWTSIQDTASKIGKSIATFINGAVETSGLGTSIGKTIGEAINTGILGLEAFVTNIHFDSVGQFIADGINSALTTIKWENVLNISNNLGSGIAKALNKVITPETLGNVGTTFGNVVNTVITGAYSFVENAEWGKWGSSIAKGINNFFKKLDWKKAGLTFSDGAKGILDSLINAIQGLDTKSITDGLKEFVKNIDFAGIAGKIFELLGTALGTIGSVIGGLIADGFSGITEYFSKETDECGGDIVAGILKGIVDGVVGIGKWIVDNIFEPFIKGFKSAFGINSPSTVMAEQGGYIISGVLNGIVSGIANIGSWLNDNVLQPILNGFSNAGEFFKSAGTTIWNGIKGGFSAVGNTVLEVGAKVATAGKDLWGNVTTAWNGVTNKVVDAGAKIATAGATLWGNVTTAWNGVTGKVVEAGAKIAEKGKNLWNNVTTAWNGVKNKTVSAAAKIGTAGKTLWGNVKSAWNGVKNKTVSAAAKIGTAGKTLWGNVKSAWKSVANKSVSASAQITEVGLKKGVSMTVEATAKITEWKDAKGNPLEDRFIPKAAATGGIYKNGKWQPIEGYASGGNPRSARLFYANENGIPELIGRIGHATAVMNNGQIVASVAAGVYQAVVAAFGRLSNYFASMSLSLSKLPDALQSMQTYHPVNMPAPIMAQGKVIPPKATIDSKSVQQLQQTIDGLNSLLNRLNGIGTQQQSGGQNNTYTFIGQINRRTLFEEMMDEAELVRHSTGRNPFEMA